MQTIQLSNKMDNMYHVTEAFNVLATNIRFSGPDIKVITVTSCHENEGKSTVIIQLAKHLTADGKRVLILDADLRKSALAIRYPAKEGAPLGFSELLSGLASLDSVIYSTDTERLDLVYAGAVPPNPVALLSHPAFANFLSDVREKYDYILIDTPPVLPVIDAALTAAKSDGILLVVSRNTVRRKQFLSVKDQLEKSGTPILGTVLNESRPPKKKMALFSRR